MSDSEYPIPKGVSFETLREIVAGWGAVGAAAEPRHTSAVAEETGIADAVGRQNAFLEGIGVLEPADDQRHRLTDAGAALATALDEGAEDRVKALLRDRLDAWPATERVRGTLRANPLDESDLAAVAAALTGHDPADGRVRSGVTTLLDAYEWTGLLETDDEGRYRLPSTSADADSAAESSGLDGLDALVSAVEDAGVRVSSGERPRRRSTPMAGEDALALSLDLTVDTNPEDMEALVRSIRRGLMADAGGAEDA